MASRNSGKKRSNRGWWWDHFTEHPGYANKEENSMVSRKAKVICTGAYKQCITREQQADQEQIRLGQRDSPRDISAITSALWATARNDPCRSWLISQPTTLLCHLRDCQLHPDDVWSHAQQEHHHSYSLNKSTCHQTLLPPAVTIQPSTPFKLAVLPQHGSHIASIHQPLPMWPSLPMLLVPVTMTSAANISPYGSPSLPPSPVLSEISSHHSKRRRLTQSGHFSTASGSRSPSTHSVSPSPGPAHWVSEVVWTSADQADWKTGLARLTASAGLPLRWIENPEWKKLCDRFLPKAKIPSPKLHTIQVHDASGDPKTAEELLKHMLLAISIIETEWGATVIAFTTDALGESWKARRLLQEKFPRLVVPDCLAHQNLIVGDLFKVKDDYGKYGNMAQELITWLRSKTQVLTLLRNIQMATMGKTLAIIRAVLTRWISHYLAYRQLLEVRPTLELLISKHETTLLASKKRATHEKAQTAITTIHDATFWHTMAR
ncbi:hypothetical protein OG21DRAFT_1488736 [Imleria badia]|nr:hypothetical protein OG21DRAFT_1488736 [Imleria badia]